jgi:hypothetical protein
LKYTNEFRGSVDRYKNLQGLKRIQIMKDFKPNIISIAKSLRKGDRIMIWHDGYQVFIKEMGASNFNITNDLEKKIKKGLTSQKK